MTREEVIQLALDIGLRAARNYKYRGSLEAMTEPERKELEQLLEFANKKEAMRFAYTSCAAFPQEPRHVQNAAWRRIVNAITKARTVLGRGGLSND